MIKKLIGIFPFFEELVPTFPRERFRGVFYCFFLFLSTTFGLAQDLERVDATILLYPNSFNKPEELSKFISRDFFTEEEKVRAIYSWIIENISYDPEEFKQFDFSYKKIDERNEKEAATREKIIKRTLQKGKAVCEGYAMLFEKLCELQGIQNYLVRGDIKTHFDDIGRPYEKIHLWNVAFIDGSPYLFDPTWGAGKYKGSFIKEPDYFYYKAPPEKLINTHYPDMAEDAFLKEVPSRLTFSERPIIIVKSLTAENILKPKMGLIRMEDYFDELFFEIEHLQTEEIDYSYGKEILPVQKLQSGNGVTTFSIPLELGVESLLLYFNDKPALGYKIQ